MRRTARAITAVALVASLACASIVFERVASARGRRRAAPPAPKALRVGVLTDGPLNAAMERMLARIKRETRLLLSSRRTVELPDDKRVSGAWSIAKIKAAASSLLADGSVDLILALGLVSAKELASRRLAKPVLVPLSADPRYSGLPVKGEVSGKKNFSYLVYSNSVVEDLRAFKDLVGARSVHVLIDKLILGMMPRRAALRRQLEKKTGLKVAPVPVGPTAAAALAALPRAAKAVYIGPLARMSDAERRLLLAGLQRRKLPTFSLLGRADVEMGALATQNRGVDLLRAARRTALNIERVVSGKDPATFPIQLRRQRKLLINMAVARAIGFAPSWRVLVYSERHAEVRRSVGRRLTLKAAVKEALRRNQSLIAARYGVAASAMKVKASYSKLLPQLDLSFNHQTIHKESARASNGTQPWHQGKLAASLSQVVFAEQAFAGVAIEKQSHRGVKQQLVATKLDVAAETAKAFINLLKAQVNAQIQQSNARVTGENLDAARVRRQVGAGQPADLYRWQSQLARDRNGAIQAMTQAGLALYQLNKLLRRPQQQRVIALPPSRRDPTLVPASKDLAPYIENPLKFRIFADFLVAEGLRAAPELRQIEASIAAKDRLFVSRRRALYLPQLQLVGELSYVAYRKLTEAEPIEIPGIGPISLGLDPGPRFSWYLGLGVSFPLFSGFEQTYARERTDRELTELRARRAALAQQIEQRIRAALSNTRAARAGIYFAERAAAAAKKGLAVARDAYARGASTTVALLDAQNNSVSAELAAATAVYDYHLALIELQRSVGRLQMFVSPAEARAWLGRLERYFATRARSSRAR